MSATRLMLPALRDVYAVYVRDAARLPDLPGPLEAEMWVSTQLGGLDVAAPHEAGRLAALGDLITSLGAARTPGARLFLSALAELGPRRARKAAAKAAASLDGVPLPSWAGRIGAVAPITAWLIQEGPLDGDRLVCEFRYRDGGSVHAVAARLGYGDAPSELVVVGDVPALMMAARQAMQAELCVVQPYDAAQVGARLRASLAEDAPLPEDLYPALALSRHRLALLS